MRKRYSVTTFIRYACRYETRKMQYNALIKKIVHTNHENDRINKFTNAPLTLLCFMF